MEVRPVCAASMGDDWAMDFLGGLLSSFAGLGCRLEGLGSKYQYSSYLIDIWARKVYTLLFLRVT